jgi:Flp pilus assembly pilin Flp
MTDTAQRLAARASAYVGTWANTTTRALKRHGDRGQGSIEYLGIIILVALIIVAVVATGIDDTIATALKSAVDKVTSAGG